MLRPRALLGHRVQRYAYFTENCVCLTHESFRTVAAKGEKWL